MTKKVCVIGGGFAGVSAVKSCIEEGLQPVCYEMRDDVGGIWDYRPGERHGRARAHKSLITNVSKEASCFSDFPFPKEWSPYITCTQFHEYIKSYIAHFELEEYIHLNTQVLSATQQEGHSVEKSGGRWKVTIRDLVTLQEDVQEFDCLMVCSGKYASPIMPQYKGLCDGVFKGTVIHSCEYDDAKEFSGKRLLVIGLGNSSGDIAVEVSLEASKTLLSTRSGAWVVPRVFQKGLPVDMTLVTRFSQLIRNFMPNFLVAWATKKVIDSGFDTGPLGIQSRYPPTSPLSSFVISDELPSRIISGRVHVRQDIKEFGPDEVYFCDGTVEKVDVVICGTGYNPSYPFLSDSVLPDDLTEMELYEWMIPFNLPEPSTMAVVGLNPMMGGSVIPVFECQTRYIAQIMSGNLELPSVDNMRKAFEEDRVNYVSHGRPFVFKKRIGLSYIDGVAKMGGFYPAFWSLFFRDPQLALAVHTGPFTPYHYRVVGRHIWTGARERILNTIKNTLNGINPKRNYSTRAIAE